ncbi:hypothetical protein FB107DRAFT_259286, partial [Schizophyllum commune]
MSDDTAWVQSQVAALGYSSGENGISSEQVVAEMEKITLEDVDSIPESDDLVNQAEDDFDEPVLPDPIKRHAEELMRAYIKEETRTTHVRIAKAFMAFHIARDPTFRPEEVSEATPQRITEFITYKCGSPDKGGQGKKFATAVSTRAALTYYYCHLPGRENESVTEWRRDEVTGKWRGLPTRSRIVSEFMVGLEKTKAAAGEVSQSARALTLDDMHRLFNLCIVQPGEKADTLAIQRQGIVRYTAYLLAWLLVLRIEEAMKLTFESIEMIPGERRFFDVRLGPRKTQQSGIAHHWRLHANDADPAICPVRAIIRLVYIYGRDLPKSGPLFLRVRAQGAIDQKKPFTSSALSRALVRDLQELGYISWNLYGTHSFRRGGCQYRIKVKGWTVDMVAAWGGWSQVEAVTMFRYFYSPNDNHERLDNYDCNDSNVPRILF